MHALNLSYFSRLLKYAEPFKLHIIWGIVCMIGVAALSAASAKMMKPIINDIFIARDANMLWPITILIIGIFFFKGLFSYAESVVMAFVGHKVIVALQKDVSQKIIYSDLSFYHRYQVGDLVSRFINDISKLNNAVTGTISSIGKDLLTLIFFIAVMFSEDAQLSLIVFFILPLAIIPITKIGRWMRKTSKQLQEQTSDLTIILTQTFQGIRLIKSYLMEQQQISCINNAILQIFKRTFKGVKIKAASHPIMELLGGLAIAMVIIYGGHQVIIGTHSAGSFFSFITALIMSYEPMKRLANLYANFQEQMAAAERVFTIMDYQNFINDEEGSQYHIIRCGNIKFSDVTFYYQAGHPILQNINLNVKAGDKVALVGPSGAGKTTLLNALPRFFDIHSGVLLIDEIDIKRYTLSSLRSQISLVSQGIILFNDTIYNNILFGHFESQEFQVIEAAKAAAAHEFISNLPNGYQTIVGEQGINLSGGQRQRIAIARAILKNAPILLLDEPTSALDSESEHIVQQTLKTLMRDKTTIMIAHRLSTIRDADVIHLMDNGRIIAAGKHQELLEKSDLYKQLSTLQFT